LQRSELGIFPLEQDSEQVGKGSKLSVLESIGVVAAVGFGAAGLLFGWRSDQRSKTAEPIARDSNRLAVCVFSAREMPSQPGQ
jgi:hypothetical protein